MTTDLEGLIASRRTRKRFTPDAPDAATVEALITAACWAPNHRLTQPWRFTPFLRPDLDQLAVRLRVRRDVLLAASDRPDKDARKLERLVDHYLPQLGAIIQVTQVIDTDPERDREDLAAVAAAVQNLLLAAEARGLAGFWSTTRLLAQPETLAWSGACPKRERLVASVWLGGRVDDPLPPPRRALDEVVRKPFGAGA